MSNIEITIANLSAGEYTRYFALRSSGMSRNNALAIILNLN